jgi:hypothetical protein
MLRWWRKSLPWLAQARAEDAAAERSEKMAYRAHEGGVHLSMRSRRGRGSRADKRSADGEFEGHCVDVMEEGEFER